MLIIIFSVTLGCECDLSQGWSTWKDAYSGWHSSLLTQTLTQHAHKIRKTGPEVIEFVFMLNSAEHEIHPAHKC